MSDSDYRQTCYFCANEWGTCTCQFRDFDPDVDESLDGLEGFDWNDFYITSPNVSVCTRFYVDPVAYYGRAFLESKFASLPHRG